MPSSDPATRNRDTTTDKRPSDGWAAFPARHLFSPPASLTREGRLSDDRK